MSKRKIPLSIVIYPYLAQLVHDTADSEQMRIFRDCCEGMCKPFISLLPALLAVKKQCPRSQPNCWYLSHFPLDWHYSDAPQRSDRDRCDQEFGRNAAG